MFFPPPPGHDLRFLTSLDLSWYTAWHSLVQACNRRKLQTSNKSAIRSGEIPRNPTCFPLLPPPKKNKKWGGGSKQAMLFQEPSLPRLVCFLNDASAFTIGGNPTHLFGRHFSPFRPLSSLLAPWVIQQTNWNYSGHTVSTAEGTSFNCRNVFFWSFNTDFG